MAFKNVGSIDKGIRLLLAIVLVAVVFAVPAISYASTIGIIMLVVAAVMAATATINFCPLYRVLNISS